MIIHRDEVHITEHKAVVVIVLQGLLKADIEQLSAIEHGVSSLVQKQEPLLDVTRPLSRTLTRTGSATHGRPLTVGLHFSAFTS